MTVLGDRSEWLHERTAGIGGSDAAAIIGLNPWKDNVQLWKEKTGIEDPEDISYKPYVQYGVSAEPLLRELFKLDFPEFQVEYIENNSWHNDRFPFARASLDGWLTDKDGRKGILEIKTTSILSSMSKEKWKEGVPDTYYCQLLHYLMVTEFSFAVLKAQLKYEYVNDIRLETRHYFIEREEVQDQIDYLESEERRFWDQVQLKQRPALRLPEI